MVVFENSSATPEWIAMNKRAEKLYAERGKTKPFEVGKSYLTNEGKTVVCIELTDLEHYECARFDDGETIEYELAGEKRIDTTGWRYNRDEDRGRCTGTAFDHSDPRCVIPKSRVLSDAN
jgi:hypothetical protein